MLSAYNGRQCVAHFEQSNIDLAFIDVAMPEMNGMEAIARLRYSGGRTFITLMSGTGGETRFPLARHLKTYEFLVKPFSPGDVHRILKSINGSACRRASSSLTIPRPCGAWSRRYCPRVFSTSWLLKRATAKMRW